MNAEMQTRNIMIAQRRTTIRLELAAWDALDEICKKEGVSRHDLCTRIDAVRGNANRAQAVRATIINYLRLALSGTAGNKIQTALRGL